MHRIMLFLVSLLMLSGLGVYFTVMAQSGSTTATVNGVVSDSESNRIKGAIISIKNLATNVVRETSSNERGDYLIQQLAPGEYELIVKAEGFKSQTAKIALSLGNISIINVKLPIGDINDTIEINADSLVSKTESSTNQGGERIDNLPINRRNFIDFSLTSPRVVIDRVPQQASIPASGLSINGQSARVNNITIDGLENNEVASGGVRSTFSQEAVSEFQVVSDSYAAEFGRASAGVVNIVTKSGTNNFHGNLFGFIRNDEISARDVFASFEPNYKQYQFGATLGGPIKRDKAFFFTAFERLSIKQNNVVTITPTTLAAIRRQQFQVSNGPLPFAIGTTTALARIDLRPTPNNLLWLRYNGGYTFNGNSEAFGGLSADTSSGIIDLSDNSFALSNTYFNTRLQLINETRFLYGRRDNNNPPLDTTNGPFVNLIAPEGGINFGRGVVLPTRFVERIYQVVNNVSLTRGRHQMKFGGDVGYTDFPLFLQTIFNGGMAVFAPLAFPLPTGATALIPGLQAFDPGSRTAEQRGVLSVVGQALGIPTLADLSIPTVFIQGFGNAQTTINEKKFSAFFQDDIRLRNNFLLKLGLRYDITRTSFIAKNDGNLSPRVAFSYSPTQLQKLKLHASYGLFFTAPLTGGAGIARVGGDQVKLLVLPFPLSIAAFNQPGRRFADMNQIPASVPFVPQFSFDFIFHPKTRSPYAHQANLGIDYYINNNTLISLNYNFVRGIKVFGQRNTNPVVRPITGDPAASLITGRLESSKGDMFSFETAFDSYYNGFSLALNQRLTKRFSLLAHYTLSKSIDNNVDVRNNTQEVADPLRVDLERALSVQDVRNRFVASGVWELNYTRHPLLRDFRLSTIINLESGRPYNLLAGVDLNQNFDNPPADRPLVNGVSIARNAGVTPAFRSVDLRLTRAISLRERAKVEVFFEVFNLFNRVNISDLARIFPPDAQGRFNLPPRNGERFIATREQFRNAFAPRQCQFGFKVIF